MIIFGFSEESNFFLSQANMHKTARKYIIQRTLKAKSKYTATHIIGKNRWKEIYSNMLNPNISIGL